MASSSSHHLVSSLFLATFLLLLLLLLLLQPHPTNASPLKICNFDKIYQVGDSISDTGNLIRESPIGAATAFAHLPYGETYFKNATGRCSNGLLMIDYFAMAAGLPFLNPYKNNDANFTHGVNYAVAGSTALSVERLAEKNISTMVTSTSLGVQVDAMVAHLNSNCHTDRDCVEKLQNSLVMVGEIGGNDYNYALLQGKTMDEVQSLVPEVVQVIADAVKRVISYGASRVVVPGNFPIGCMPIYLTAFRTNNSAAYDDNHCLKNLNEFAMYHNDQLQQAIEGLKKEYPDVVIVYGDYYNTFQWLFNNAPILGFDSESTQKACCGTGGDYNFDMGKMCGAPEVTVCENPDQFISWDGVHLTQQAYKVMAGWLLNNIQPKLQCPF